MNLTDLKKTLSKAIPEVSIGFNNPKHWISTGNYALNYRISGDFFKGVPLGKVTIFAGESGSGKSYICSGNLVREALNSNINVVLIDTENAIDEGWLQRLGVDTNHENLMRVNLSLVDDIAKVISKFATEYKKDYADLPKEDRPKFLFVVDSLGMALTKAEIEQFQKGDLKGDMGIKAKTLNAFIRNCVSILDGENIGLVCTNHTYQSQDMFDPDPKISGGQGIIYAASIVVAMGRLKLKEDEEGAKVSKVTGIRARCKVMKTRFTKPFEEVEIKIPYNKGMDPYSGLFQIFLDSGLFTRVGNKYEYVDSQGNTYRMFEKEINKNKDGILDLVMKEIMEKKRNFAESDPEEEMADN